MSGWLVGNCELFGFTGQNWMLVVAGALIAYVVALAVIARFRQKNPGTSR